MHYLCEYKSNISFMNKIEVWDGICGMGKTFKTRKLIVELTGNKAHFNITDPKVIYITPYREEVFIMANVKYKTKKNPSTGETKVLPDYKISGVIQRVKPRPRDVAFSFEMESNIFGMPGGAE